MQCEKRYRWSYLCTDFFKSTQVGVCNNMRHLGEGANFSVLPNRHVQVKTFGQHAAVIIANQGLNAIKHAMDKDRYIQHV